ncbi:hypothetical protein P7C73_g4336, partial [Tremellales sp. Uapishka_1]
MPSISEPLQLGPGHAPALPSPFSHLSPEDKKLLYDYGIQYALVAENLDAAIDIFQAVVNKHRPPPPPPFSRLSLEDQTLLKDCGIDDALQATDQDTVVDIFGAVIKNRGPPPPEFGFLLREYAPLIGGIQTEAEAAQSSSA